MPSEATALREALVRMADAHSPHPRINCRPRGAYSTASGGWRSTNDPIAGFCGSGRRFSNSNPDDSSVLDRLRRAAQGSRIQRTFRAWKARLHVAYRGSSRKKDTWYLPTPRRERGHHAKIRKRRHLFCSTTSPKASTARDLTV